MGFLSFFLCVWLSEGSALVDLDDNGSGAAAPNTDHHLSVLAGAPKLEDFLGGAPAVAQFDGGVGMPDMEMYDDSELKTIATSFLRGFSSDQQTDSSQKQITVPPEPPAKKAVESFGQRTSIFRGVTRYRYIYLYISWRVTNMEA